MLHLSSCGSKSRTLVFLEWGKSEKKKGKGLQQSIDIHQQLFSPQARRVSASDWTWRLNSTLHISSWSLRYMHFSFMCGYLHVLYTSVGCAILYVFKHVKGHNSSGVCLLCTLRSVVAAFHQAEILYLCVQQMKGSDKSFVLCLLRLSDLQLWSLSVQLTLAEHGVPTATMPPTVPEPSPAFLPMACTISMTSSVRNATLTSNPPLMER